MVEDKITNTLMIQRKAGQGRGGFTSLYKEVRKGFPENMMLNRDPQEVRMQVSWISKKEHPNRGSIRCKGPEAGTCCCAGGTEMRPQWLRKRTWEYRVGHGVRERQLLHLTGPC